MCANAYLLHLCQMGTAAHTSSRIYQGMMMMTQCCHRVPAAATAPAVLPRRATKKGETSSSRRVQHHRRRRGVVLRSYGASGCNEKERKKDFFPHDVPPSRVIIKCILPSSSRHRHTPVCVCVCVCVCVQTSRCILTPTLLSLPPCRDQL